MNERKNCVFIGDSLTQWCDWEQRFPEHRVTNLGIAGETVEGLLNRRESIRAAIENPSYIFLMTGINNIATEQYDFIDPYREVVRNLTTWYKRATIVVQSILPVELTFVDHDRIRDTNRQLEQIAREFSAAYLDVYSLFVDPTGNPLSECLQEDGVHVSRHGYDVWTEAVGRYLKK